MKKRLLHSLFLMLFIASQALAQNRTVSGTVTAKEDGLPLPGVSVKVSGTQVGTQTGADGKFALAVPSGSNSLQLTYIGYMTQTVKIPASNSINIVLSADAKVLGEVVVTALGISRQKKDLGYASATIGEASVTRATPVNIANGLQGKVSGLNVTSVNNGVFENVKINLRGIRSLTGNNNPLLVLDGIQTNINFLSSLNPNDIENVTVIKGSSGAAIYGPDAVNGVIIVTTKKSIKGENKPEINYSHATQAQQISFFPKFQETFGSGGGGEYIPYENWSWGPAFDGKPVLIGDPLPDGSENIVPFSPTNDRKDFFNTGVTSQNDISLRAKDFYISIQDANIKGIVPDDKNRRSAIRLNTSKEYGKVTVGLNTNYIQQNYNIFDDISMADWNADNNVGLNQGLMNLIFNTPAQIPLKQYKDFTNDKFSSYNQFFNHYGLNPYFALDNWRKEGRREDLITNLQFDFKATNWLSFTYRAGLTNQMINESRTSKGEVPNEFGEPRGANVIPGFAEERSFRSSRLSSEAFANINRQINDDFKVNAIVGTYVRQTEARDTRAGTTNLVVPELFNFDNRLGELIGDSPYSKSRLFSVFASAGINYKGWLNVEVTGRNDKTSVLAEGKNSLFYPGISGSFILTDAVKSLQNDYLSYLKIRGAWNKTGNADIAPYRLAATFSPAGGFPYGTLPGFTANNTTFDAQLEPEFVETKEFGIETGFLNSRINLEASYYNQNNDNQIIPISVSAATGYTQSNVNAASFINKGVELDLRLTPLVKLGDVNIEFRSNASYNTSEIKSIYTDLNELEIGGVPDAGNYAIRNYPAFVLKATDYVRDPQGRVVVDQVTGLPTQNPNNNIFGRTMPTWILGLNPSVGFKGLNLSALFEYKGGHYAYHDIGNAMAWTGVSAATARNNRERFVFPNSSIENADGTFRPNTDVTVNNVENFFVGVYRDVASNFITSAASWRLREVALSYNIPAKFLQRQKAIKAVNLALTGRNLALWLPKTNEYTDPDFNFSGSNTSGTTSNRTSINNSTINPPTRIFGFNVNLTF